MRLFSGLFLSTTTGSSPFTVVTVRSPSWISMEPEERVTSVVAMVEEIPAGSPDETKGEGRKRRKGRRGGEVGEEKKKEEDEEEAGESRSPYISAPAPIAAWRDETIKDRGLPRHLQFTNPKPRSPYRFSVSLGNSPRATQSHESNFTPDLSRPSTPGAIPKKGHLRGHRQISLYSRQMRKLQMEQRTSPAKCTCPVPCHSGGTDGSEGL